MSAALRRRESSRETPLLIASLFYRGHKVVMDGAKGLVDRDALEREIRAFVDLCREFRARCAVDVEFESIGALESYLRHVIDLLPEDFPVLVDSGVPELRVRAAELVSKLGISERAIINSVSSRVSAEELSAYRRARIRGLVISDYDSNLRRRAELLLSTYNRIKSFGLSDAVYLVDLAVMDLPDLINVMSVVHDLKESLDERCLVGLAPVNAAATWRQADAVANKIRERFKEVRLRLTIRSSLSLISALHPDVDFIFFGPIGDAVQTVPLVSLMLSADVSRILESTRMLSLKRREPSQGELRCMDAESRLASMIVDLDERAIAYAKQLLDSGYPSSKIVEALQTAMDEVGRRFERGEYFVTELISAGEICEKIVEHLMDYIRESGPKRGRIILGTIEGDIHSIGKNIVKMVLSAYGFEVIDLGVDVPAERFVEAVKKYNAKFIGISALLTTSVRNVAKVVKLLEREGLRDKVKIIIGGAAVDESVAKELRVDAYARNAYDAVKILNRWLSESNM